MPRKLEKMKKYALTFLCILLTNCLLAQDKSTLTPQDIARMKHVSYTIISKDGNKVAYLVAEQADPVKENKPMSNKLNVLDLSTGYSTPYITQGTVENIMFRPGFGTLTFVSKREEDNAIALYEISLTGGEAQKILGFETSIANYDWSPDGKRIAFIAKKTKEKGKNTLPYQPEIYEEDLIYSRVYIADIGNGKPVEIQEKGSFYSIKWSPDGQKIAASAAPTPLVDDSFMKQMIYVFKSSDLSKINEVNLNAKLGQFVWSPDGKKLAILSGEDINDPIDGRIIIVDLKNAKPKNLHPDFPGKFETIRWAAQNTIQFIASEGVYTTLGSLNVKNNEITKTIDKGSTAFTTFSLAENGNMALIGSSAQYPPELHLAKAGTVEPKKMTNSNPWLSELELGKQEVVTYKARDGLKIEGILIRPLNEEKNKKYPLITVVHGGPEAHYSNGWITAYSRPGQLAATNGYAVFYPNYRGSTGRGVEFLKSSQRDPAGKEFDDIIDGIDYLIASGLVDKNKVGVTGGSYGGYATGWLSTRYSERFAAGVMFVGISNKLSAWGTSDIPEEKYHVHFLKHIWEDFIFFLKRSPIYHAGKAKTPLLIMTGKDDPRVSPTQSYELYRHIKTRTETPVRLVLYPGEEHGNKKSTARFDYNLRMMRWFDTYLKKNGAKMPEREIENWR